MSAGESLEELAAQAERSRLEAIEEARLARVLAQAEAYARFCACGSRVDDTPESHVDNEGIEWCSRCCAQCKAAI